MDVPESLLAGMLRVTRANGPFRTAGEAERAIRSLSHLRRAPHPPALLGWPRADVWMRREAVQGRPVWLVTPRDAEPTGGVLYAHGGGWLYPIVWPHWALVAQVAAEARVAVAVPQYELLPDGDAASAHALMLRLHSELASAFGDVRLTGDSAGGQIALSTALSLRDSGVQGVRTVLISPALDLRLANPAARRVQPRDPWLGIDGVRVLGGRWAGTLALEDPRVSPLLGDLHGLGPMLVLTGTRDVLSPDARLLVQRAREAGVEAQLVEREGGLHVWPLLPVAGAGVARARIVDALREACEAGRSL